MIRRFGWIVFVVILIAFILVGAYRAVRHEETRPPTSRAAPYH
jgi:hypothetical protein